LEDLPIAAHPPELEFWFEFGSNYSYLALMRVEALATRNGVALRWRPFLLGPVFRQLGWSTSPFVLQEAKGRYMWRDMEREAHKYGLPFVRPSVFPRKAVLPMRVATLGAREAWMGAFCRRVMRQNWVEDLDIDDPANVLRALDGLVDDPQAIVEAALLEPNKARLRASTEEALARGVFGGPTMFVGEEMFWGNDRLEDAIAWAASVRG